MSIEQINNIDAVSVKKKSVEKWTRQNIPQLNATNISQHLLSMTLTEKQFEAFLMQLLQHLVSVTHSLGAVYYFLDEKQKFTVGPQLLSKELMTSMPDIVGRLSEQATPVVKTGNAKVVAVDSVVGTVVPIKSRDGNMHVLVAVYPPKTNHEHQLMNNQLMSSYIHLWRSVQENNQLNTESYFSSALLELMTLLQQSESKKDFDSLLVNQLQSILGCHQVAFGRYKDLGGQFQLTTVSGVSEIDQRNNFKSLLESCAFEVKQYGKTVSLSQKTPSSQDSSLLASHQRLLANVEAEHLVSKTLHSGDDELVGAIICWWSKTPSDIQLKQQFIDAAEQPISNSIVFASDNKSQLFKTNKKSAWFRYKYMLLALLATILLLFVFLPVEHKVVTKVSLEPVFQRIVSTRYDGVLKDILVKPGEQVEKGQVLASLDDQDLLLKQQSLQADYDSALKDRSLKVAAAQVSEAQIASLEIQRISLEIKLLEEQLTDLSIMAPISGVVISEEIDRRQGSLLKKGEALFEIAPLEEMYASLMIPAQDITHVQLNAPLEIQFDALPKRQWQASVDNIQPRTEVVDSENVFVAKVPLQNDAGLVLKPGMRGQASIAIGQRPLGWVLFHKAFIRISRWFAMTFTSPQD